MTDMILMPTIKPLKKTCVLLLIGWCLPFVLNAAEMGIHPSIEQASQTNNRGPELQVPFETLLALATMSPKVVTTEGTPTHTPRQPLLLEELIRQVVTDNQQIQMQKTDWMIRQAEADQTRAIFEPEFTTSLEREVNNQRNSVEESLSQGLATTYTERNWNYDAAVQALAPTGGKVKLGYNLNQLSNSLTQSLTNEEKEYQMYLGATLTQPLLKNAGAKVTKAGIMSADLESSAAFQEYRLKMMQRVSKVSVDYWDYYQAYKKLALRNDSHRIAEQILNDNEERYRTGKMAETEVLEAVIGVSSRKSLISETAHEQLEIANRLRSLLALTGSSPEYIKNRRNIPDEKLGHNKETIQQKNEKQVTAPETIVRTEFKHIIDNSTALKFAYGECSLTSSMKKDLDELAATFKEKPNLFFKVIGHTDSHMLSPEKAKIYVNNFGFGRVRAENTAKYLAEQLGTDKSQYKVDTAGPHKPVANNNTAAGRAKNRRVEIFISFDQQINAKKQAKRKPETSPVEVVLPRASHPLNLAISEPERFEQQHYNSTEITETAFKLRPEYLAARKKLEQADIKISFAKNQRWPELDLLASYGMNGLDFETGDSWKQIEGGDYASWAAGLQLRLPLQGGIESRSKLRKSELEKRRQLMVLKDIEIELKNRIDTAIDNIARTSEQLKYAEQIIDIQKRLFDAELAKLKAGQSSSRLVLEKEDNYRSAREAALVNTVKCQRALIEMELASGAILQQYGVDIMETEL